MTDERRAEVEAVAVRIFNNGQWAMRSVQGTDDRRLYDRAAEDIKRSCRATAREYIAAVDRVRDARGDDEGMTERELEDAAQWHGDTRSPQVEDHEAEPHEFVAGGPRGSCKVCAWSQRAAHHQPQGEDHEVGLEEATRIVFGTPTRQDQRHVMGGAIAAYLSRVSPSRDGTVAVEDVLQALVDEARGDDEWVSGHDLLVRVGAIVMDRLAARSATGEQTDHGGDQ